MTFNEKEKSYTVTGYTTKIYLNETGDIVISQNDDFDEKMSVLIGREQVNGIIVALSKLIDQ